MIHFSIYDKKKLVNCYLDFMPPRITEKVPLFGTDKWVERQNRYIAKHFTEIVRKIESLYKIDAVRQVEAAQRNVLADYGEFYRLKRENLSLLEINQELESELNTLLSQLAVPSIRNMIFAIADALIGRITGSFSSRNTFHQNFTLESRIISLIV